MFKLRQYLTINEMFSEQLSYLFRVCNDQEIIIGNMGQLGRGINSDHSKLILQGNK